MNIERGDTGIPSSTHTDLHTSNESEEHKTHGVMNFERAAYVNSEEFEQRINRGHARKESLTESSTSKGRKIINAIRKHESLRQGGVFPLAAIEQGSSRAFCTVELVILFSNLFHV